MIRCGSRLLLFQQEAEIAKPVKPVKLAPKREALKKAVPASNGTGSTAKPAVDPVLNAPAPVPGQQPSMKILGQYMKDFSFENPNAPASLAPQTQQPDINISVNVNARNLAPNDFEVELHLDAKATADGKVIFAADLLYAGIFQI